MFPASFAQLSRHLQASKRPLNDAIREKASIYEETQVYIGLNDADTKKQELETDYYIDTLKAVCRKFGIPFSFDMVQGGYIHDNGEYTEELSIVLTFIDVERNIVEQIAREVCKIFNQESVLVTSEAVKMRSIRPDSQEEE